MDDINSKIPTRPIYMVRIKINLAAVETVAVIPVESPTVPKADTTSKRI